MNWLNKKIDVCNSTTAVCPNCGKNNILDKELGELIRTEEVQCKGCNCFFKVIAVGEW